MWQTTADRPAVVYDAEESSAMDVWLVEQRGFTIPQLMAQAGARVAEAIRDLAREHDLTRVVFLVTPHRGAELANAWFARFFAATIRLPQDLTEHLAEIRAATAEGVDGQQGDADPQRE